jgi:hypothetical protein
VKQPFVRTPAGRGSRRAFEPQLEVKGIDLLRTIDKLARANPDVAGRRLAR